MTRKPPVEFPDPWRVTTWNGHREAQLASALLATPAQRLAWLEEALATAYHAGALPFSNPERRSPQADD